MSEELKYCKFCDKEKPIKEFCKSGSFIKNICRECQNKKQKQIYQNSKKVEELQTQLQQKESIIKEVRKYIKELKNFKIKYVMFEEKELYASENDFVKDILEILDKGE